MAAPSVTYTFTNGTTASATEVNQNFTDIINGLTDGTEDLTISALTVGGVATFNGNVTLGNATADDLTISASLAATINIKTNNSFDIGSATLGLASVYLGAPSSRTTRVRSNQSLSASYTLTLPDGGGTSRYYPETDGSGNLSWRKPSYSGADIRNLAISFSVAANALTATVAGYDGTALSSTNFGTVLFRNATAGTGSLVEREITANLTLTVSSGSTLGFISGLTHYLYWYIADDGGTYRIGVSQALFDEGTLQSSTAEGGAGAADSGRTLYTGTGVTSKAIRLFARTKHSLTTAGTWDEAPDEVSVYPFSTIPASIDCYNSASPTANSGAFADIIFNSRTTDPRGMLNTATGEVTIPESGYYNLAARLSSATPAANSVTAHDFRIRLNASSTLASAAQNVLVNSKTYWSSMTKNGVFLSAGDVLTVQYAFTTTDNSTLNGGSSNTYFGVTRV